MPFLLPESAVTPLPIEGSPPLGAGVVFAVWPYAEGPEQALARLPRPALLHITQGPAVQGDKDPTPYPVALILRADPLPETLPPPLARFEQGIALQGFALEEQEGELRVTLRWHATEALGESYVVFVHYLRGEERLAQHDGGPGRGYLPTTTWLPGEIILDEHALGAVTVNAAEDLLRVGLYHAGTGAGLSVLDEAGNPAGHWVELPVRPRP